MSFREVAYCDRCDRSEDEVPLRAREVEGRETTFTRHLCEGCLKHAPGDIRSSWEARGADGPLVGIHRFLEYASAG